MQIYAKATKPAMVCEREVGTKCPEPFIMGEGDWKDRTDQWGQTKEVTSGTSVPPELAYVLTGGSEAPKVSPTSIESREEKKEYMNWCENN